MHFCKGTLVGHQSHPPYSADKFTAAKKELLVYFGQHLSLFRGQLSFL